MPALDRRIIVRRTVHSRNEFGESTVIVTDYQNWATREDASQQDKEMAGGVLTLAARAYLIRYRQEIDAAPTSELTVIDGTVELNVTNITEATRQGERRKFLRIEAIGEV